MKGMGAGLILVGLALIGWGLFFNATVETPATFIGGYQPSQTVYNLGALQMQEMIFSGGLASFLSGCLLYAIGELRDALVRGGSAKADETPPLGF